MATFRLLLVTALTVVFVAVAYSQTVTPAPQCSDDIREKNCTLPACRCSGTDIPGNFTSDQIPQLVYLTFDDAVSIDNYGFYEEVLFNRKNPNNESITATFYVTHEYTNYSMIHELNRRGHDIALHSMTHNPSTTYWASLTETEWRQEIVDQRTQLANFARISTADIKGIRAPFLQGGGDVMYKVLTDAKFVWDCSRPTLTFRDPGLWPYTNDFRSNQDCQIAPCPVGEYKGFWTVPMVDMMGSDGFGCAMVDTCGPIPTTQKETYDMLVRNFNTHYNGNRAPFGVFTHAAWLNGTCADCPEIPQRRLGYIQFLDYLGTRPDVYIVGVSRAVEWVKTPKNITQSLTFAPFKVPAKASSCPNVYTCRYGPEASPFPTERYMHSCVPCPARYPWIGNPLGRP